MFPIFLKDGDFLLFKDEGKHMSFTSGIRPIHALCWNLK